MPRPQDETAGRRWRPVPERAVRHAAPRKEVGITMVADTSKRLKPDGNRAAIRCYGQGLGDCFLLAFPRPGKPDQPFYVVIDCGIASGTPDEEVRMQKV